MPQTAFVVQESVGQQPPDFAAQDRIHIEPECLRESALAQLRQHMAGKFRVHVFDALPRQQLDDEADDGVGGGGPQPAFFAGFFPAGFINMLAGGLLHALLSLGMSGLQGAAHFLF